MRARTMAGQVAMAIVVVEPFARTACPEFSEATSEPNTRVAEICPRPVVHAMHLPDCPPPADSSEYEKGCGQGAGQLALAA